MKLKIEREMYGNSRTIGLTFSYNGAASFIRIGFELWWGFIDLVVKR